ncbi:MAG: PLP-dependent aminotransferase family protein [Microbacteriaceae bacterium]
MSSVSARALALLLDNWRNSPAPAYLALAERIRLLVLDGRIGLDARLPAERDLAAQLNVSRTTVSATYAELRDAGYLESLRGSGSIAKLPQRGVPHGQLSEPGFLDLTKAAMPAIPVLAAAARTAAEQLPAYLGDSGFDPIGIPVLRQAIADRYTQRGLPTDPEQIMVTIGAQHAIALLARTLLGRGDRALVESPSYPHAYEALRVAGARLVAVNVTTDDGWDEGGLEQVIQRTSPSLGYLMPDFHNPTGRSMSAGLREKTVALAERHGTTLLADETMAELAIDDGVAPLPLAAYGDVITIGSVGKTVWGGVRVGWIRAERPVIQRLVRARSSGDLGTPILEQLMVVALLDDFDAILASRREQLRAGRDQLLHLLADRIPEWQVPRPAGGLTTWVNVGAPVSSQLTLAARSVGLHIAAGPRFGIDGAFERFLRIPFGHNPEEITRAVDGLAAAWAVVAQHPLPSAESIYLAEVV